MFEIVTEQLSKLNYVLERPLNTSCDFNLLKKKPVRNTEFYCLNKENSEESLGIKYILDKKDENIRKELLPRGNSFTRKVAFLDRDGILIEDTNYPGKVEDVIFKPDVAPLLKTLLQAGYELVVITNQSGIARGKYTENDFFKTTVFINEYYQSLGIPLLETFYCPYHIDGEIDLFTKDSILRKPEAGMVMLAAEKYEIDLSQSIMIGDKLSDILNCTYLKYFIVKDVEHRNCYRSFDEIRSAVLNL